MATFDFIWIIWLKGKRYPNPKKSKYPAGLDSKIRILYTATSRLHQKFGIIDASVATSDTLTWH